MEMKLKDHEDKDSKGEYDSSVYAGQVEGNDAPPRSDYT